MYMLVKLNNDPDGNLQQEIYYEVSGFVFLQPTASNSMAKCHFCYIRSIGGAVGMEKLEKVSLYNITYTAKFTIFYVPMAIFLYQIL